jgi:hypothetical protein
MNDSFMNDSFMNDSFMNDGLTSMKAFLLSDSRLQDVFMNYHERLQDVVIGDILIDADEALLLLSHHVFIMPITREIMRWELSDAVSILLDDTIQKIRNILETINRENIR